MSIHLTINGLPICGVVGQGERIVISADECWGLYWKWLERRYDRSTFSIIRKYAIWAVNGSVIQEPKAWFIVMEDSVNES